MIGRRGTLSRQFTGQHRLRFGRAAQVRRQAILQISHTARDDKVNRQTNRAGDDEDLHQQRRAAKVPLRFSDHSWRIGRLRTTQTVAGREVWVNLDDFAIAA